MQRHAPRITVGDGSRQSRVLAMLLWLQLGDRTCSPPVTPQRFFPSPNISFEMSEPLGMASALTLHQLPWAASHCLILSLSCHFPFFRL